MQANGTKFRCLGTNNNVTAVTALPNLDFTLLDSDKKTELCRKLVEALSFGSLCESSIHADAQTAIVSRLEGIEDHFFIIILLPVKPLSQYNTVPGRPRVRGICLLHQPAAAHGFPAE